MTGQFAKRLEDALKIIQEAGSISEGNLTLRLGTSPIVSYQIRRTLIESNPEIVYERLNHSEPKQLWVRSKLDAERKRIAAEEQMERDKWEAEERKREEIIQAARQAKLQIWQAAEADFKSLASFYTWKSGNKELSSEGADFIKKYDLEGIDLYDIKECFSAFRPKPQVFFQLREKAKAANVAKIK